MKMKNNDGDMRKEEPTFRYHNIVIDANTLTDHSSVTDEYITSDRGRGNRGFLSNSNIASYESFRRKPFEGSSTGRILDNSSLLYV